MKRKIIIGLLCLGLIVAMLGAVSAKTIDYKEKITLTKYYPRDDVSLTHTISAEYNNENRFSTYDYRHGYSYRTSLEYWEEKHDFDFNNDRNDKGNYKRDYKLSYRKSYREKYLSNRWKRDNADYYLKYSFTFDKIEKKKCYDNPPRGKLFYIRCPWD